MATFQNIYYKRTVATAKACYMCFRPTTTVLATLNTTDFLYTCDAHLTDRGFATLIEPPPDEVVQAKKVSDEEIRRVKEEWEERQRRKQEKAKEDKEAESSSKDKEKDSKNLPVSSPKPPPPPPSPIPIPGSTAAARPTHQRYTLHRDVWAMRLAEHKKKRQTRAVKEVAPRLPVTPRGSVA